MSARIRMRVLRVPCEKVGVADPWAFSEAHESRRITMRKRRELLCLHRYQQQTGGHPGSASREQESASRGQECRAACAGFCMKEKNIRGQR